MEEGTLIKSGEVSVQVKGLLKSSWVNKFCTLHKKTADNHAYMELYDDKQSYENYRLKNKKCDIKKIELQHVKSIRSSSENTGKGMEHLIEIRMKFQKHFLMFKHEKEFSDWLAKLNITVDIADRGSGEGSASYSGDVINSDDDDDDDDDEVITLNQMYASTDTAQRFEVEVEPSDLAKICGIEGKMTLLVGNNDIAFEDPKTKRVKYSFQLAWMRRFGKYKSQSFNFEVGRKCPNGQGSVTSITPSAKAIHKLVTQKSSSRSKLVIPHPHTDDEMSSEETKSKKPSVSNMDDEPPPPVKERQGGAISQPTFANNLVRKHPGKANTPNLIPIVRQHTDDSQSMKKPKTPPQPARRGSKSKSRTSGKESPEDEKKMPTLQDNGHVRPQSYKVAVNSGEFAKELEQKLHVGNVGDDHQDVGKSHEPGKKDSVKTKEDKKREKEEKKEKERKEKEEKKERERKEKEIEREKKLREKEEKKSGKKDKQKDSAKNQDKPKTHQMSVRERIYDEPETATAGSPEYMDDPSGTYDEVSSPRQTHAPAEYAQSTKIKRSVHKGNMDDIYDEAVSPTQGKNTIPEKVEYAEPYSKKGGIPVPQEPAMYADVKTVEKDAWKKLGRKEEEEHFEEDYGNIKSAREQVKKQTPPPIPAKNYGDEDVDENMYNTVDLKRPKSASKSKPENLYGIASATEVGELPTDMVLIPERDYPSDSGESLQEEEATYEDPQYEGYEAPSDVKKNSTKKTKVVEAYEDTAVPLKPSPPKQTSKRVHQKETLYEEIS